jgi:hypothetical protein
MGNFFRAVLPGQLRWENLRGKVIRKRLSILPGQCLTLRCAFKLVGISFEGNVKGFLDFMAHVVEGQRLEVPIFTPKIKGKRGLQNLECDTNYDAWSLGSTRCKSKRALAVL